MNDIHGRVYADKSVVNVQDFTFAEADGGRYTAKGGMKFDDSRQLFGVLDVTNGSVKNLLTLLDRSNEHIDGKLNGSVEIGGTRDNPSVNVTGKINDVSIDEKIVGDATIDASLANRKFKVTTLKLPVDEGLIAIGGTMDLDGQADLQVALKDVDIVPFLPLMGKDIQATGWVTGVVNITGETKNPKVELSGAVESGSFNGVGIDEGFDASMFIGYHSAASEDGNPLAHTMNSVEYDYIKLNGMILSEFIMNAYTSIYYGIPVAFLSGDEMLCENAKKIFPNLVTVAVSKGIGNGSVSIHPNLAVKRINEGVKEALSGDLSRHMIKLPEKFEIEIKFRNHFKAYRASFYPGVEKLDSQTIKFVTNDYYEFLRMFLFI